MPAEIACLEVAILGPLPRIFSYALPSITGPLPPGVRLRVPFGKTSRVGILLGYGDCPPDIHLKPIEAVIDTKPLLPEVLQQLLHFGARYYHHPLGDVWSAALPALLRQGRSLPEVAPRVYQLSRSEQLPPRPGSRQMALISLLSAPKPIAEIPTPLRPILQQALKKGWVEARTLPTPQICAQPVPYALNSEQSQAILQLRQNQGFSCWLLDGVTGSGKTEVYFETIRPHLEAGQQVLILVPEIGLTPQLLARCQTRFGSAGVAALHSAQSDTERLRIWTRAATGQLQLLIGTRSTLFVPLPRLACIIIDEEHDPSFKQHQGWHYSARDMAIQRARLEQIPVILGSATPSLESLYNVQQGRYQLLQLRQRATKASLPGITIIPLRRQYLQGGLSSTLLSACRDTLAAGNQVLLFLNRRGYAPAVLCHDCGHVLHCPRCSAALTWHRQQERLRCHHCGHESRWPADCPECHSAALVTAGQGTEQLEEVLCQRFTNTPVWRIDRDALPGREGFARILEQIHQNQPAILVGTQMLAKGHHFPAVTLVGIINTDQGLFSADFRAPERLLQTVLQVAGRAGREDRPGQVLLQTHLPQHPLIQKLASGDYHEAAQLLLQERIQARLPPYTALTLLSAEAHQRPPIERFLKAARYCAPAFLQISGPQPALLEKRAGFERAELWVEAPTRQDMQKALRIWLPLCQKLPEARKVRWSVDVDPQSLR
ncbi:primosomal protein N' [Acidithiobacillus montserratensis]|uniref:Primosomal protein N n=1 Tax=Acidithiobacillus montserratensis TaxID=2729135 RepID=A0ACD5HDH1_9PROT|nr:primosomal protein N' [Acidithiobacillus montserratensis]MBU2747948.1 primosomal protein N' [Acidithiobacillus montserratensis]